MSKKIDEMVSRAALVRNPAFANTAQPVKATGPAVSKIEMTDERALAIVRRLRAKLLKRGRDEEAALTVSELVAILSLIDQV